LAGKGYFAGRTFAADGLVITIFEPPGSAGRLRAASWLLSLAVAKCTIRKAGALRVCPHSLVRRAGVWKLLGIAL